MRHDGSREMAPALLSGTRLDDGEGCDSLGLGDCRVDVYGDGELIGLKTFTVKPR